MSLWSRLKSGLSRSSDALGSSLSGLMGGKKLSPETLGELEDALIMADLGVATAATITENLRVRRDLAELDDAALRAALAPTLSIIHAVLSTSNRACSISMRDRAIHSETEPCCTMYLPKALRSWARAVISSSASSAAPMERMQ